MSFRQRIAARTPGALRKVVRMALNYPYRLGMWFDVLREIKPADPRSRRVLWLSALAAPLTALRALDGYRVPQLLGDIMVVVRGIGRFAVRSGTDDLIHVMCSREPWMRDLIEGELKDGGTFVDGGANIGFYTLLAARRVGADGRVVSIEMMPGTAAILRRHVADNGPLPVTVIERALSDRSGAQVSASVEPGKFGQASIAVPGSQRRETVTVETITLDEALAGLSQIDLIKLDLEGAEFMALSGAKAVLARTNCLVFESNDRDARIFALLEAEGFTVSQIGTFDFVARPLKRAKPERLQ